MTLENLFSALPTWQNSFFVQHDIIIRDLNFGDRPPRVRRAQLLKTDPDNEDLEVVRWLEVFASKKPSFFLIASGLFVFLHPTASGLGRELFWRCKNLS